MPGTPHVAGPPSPRSGGDYGEEGFVYEEYAPLPDFGGNRPVIGSWIIGQEPAGMGIRESVGPIADILTRFVPRRIVNPLRERAARQR